MQLQHSSTCRFSWTQHLNTNHKLPLSICFPYISIIVTFLKYSTLMFVGCFAMLTQGYLNRLSDHCGLTLDRCGVKFVQRGYYALHTPLFLCNALNHCVVTVGVSVSQITE